MKKFRKNTSLAPTIFLHYRSDWTQEFVLTITQKTYLTNTTENICCYSNDKI